MSRVYYRLGLRECKPSPCCVAVTHQFPLRPVPLLLDLLPPFFMFKASHC